MDLLAPLALGAQSAANRLMFGPHETNLGTGRALSERHVAYYQRRAVGGAGIIVTEEASVDASDWPYERCPLASECGPGWSAIVSACAASDSLVIAALGHSGGQGSSAYSQRPLLAPSRVPEVNTREVPKSMEPSEIEAIVASFGEATRVAVGAGCHGVEINAGQYSLIRQFLSGLTNLRGDDWSDRVKFARDVLVAVRAAAGPAVVGLRLSCDELAPWAGLVPDAAAAIATELAQFVDYLVVVRGSIYSTSATRPDSHTEPGFNLDLVQQIRESVRSVHGDRVPVFAQGSIVDPNMADDAISSGRCDGVEMTRAQIADADLASKVRSGRLDQIRPCVLCNQTCMARDARNPIVTCIVDPRTGHELSDPPEDRLVVVPLPTVTVVGGGPAGLEAARVAALNGCSVRLLEKSERVGGMVEVASAGVGRSRLSKFVEWQRAECERLGVVIETGTFVADPDVSELHGPLVIATGSLPRDVEYASTRGADIRSAADVLAESDPGAALPSGPVLVWDPIGGPIAVSVAELLASSGRDVIVATPDNIVGNELSRSGDLAPANARLQQAGVRLERRSLLRSVKKGSALLDDRFSGEQRQIKCAVVIDCGHRLPNDALYRESSNLGGRDVARAGDCVAPRTILEAVREGRSAVAALSGSGRLSDGVAMGVHA